MSSVSRAAARGVAVLGEAPACAGRCGRSCCSTSGSRSGASGVGISGPAANESPSAVNRGAASAAPAKTAATAMAASTTRTRMLRLPGTANVHELRHRPIAARRGVLRSTSPRARHRVFIPAWNEAASLPALLEEAQRDLPEADLLVIDDGSTDDTAAVSRAGGAQVVSFPENHGLRHGIAEGYRQAATARLRVLRPARRRRPAPARRAQADARDGAQRRVRRRGRLALPAGLGASTASATSPRPSACSAPRCCGC